MTIQHGCDKSPILPSMGTGAGLEGHTAQAVFTIVDRVQPAQVDAVRELLARIAADPAQNDLLPFGRLSGLHYASLVLHANDVARPLLVLEGNVDGTADALLRRLVEDCGEAVDALWSNCVGYPTTGVDDEQRVAYFRDHLVLPGAYHVGTTGHSREQIEAEAELRRAIATFVDEQRASGALPATSLGVRQAIVDHVGGHPDLAWALEAPVTEGRRSRLRRAIFLTRSSDRRVVLPAVVVVAVVLWAIWRSPIRALLGTVVVVGLLAGLFRWRESREIAEDRSVPDALLDGVEVAEDRPGVVTNHLSSLVDIKPGRRILLRAVLLVIDVAARITYTKGQLGGIPSIHFAHWSLVDGGRRLLFVSNYDGSWESYLDDFIEKAASGLSAVWSNTENFPRARWLGILPDSGGARYGPAFKRVARNSQSPTTIHYCAYPALSVTNVLDNTRLRRGLVGTMDEEQAWAWLSRL
jgi:hypothetical protein